MLWGGLIVVVLAGVFLALLLLSLLLSGITRFLITPIRDAVK